MQTCTGRGSRRGRDRCCVGWTGSPSTVPNLQVIRGPLAHLAAATTCGCGSSAPSFRLEGSRTRALPWSAETEVDDLRALDVGLLPLPETPWTRRKLYLKLVQYMALGLPTVATPLGANTTMIEPGRTGLLARDDADGSPPWSASSRTRSCGRAWAHARPR